MDRTKIAETSLAALALACLLLGADPASAQPPPGSQAARGPFEPWTCSSVSTTATVPKSIYNLPDGTGHPLSNCFSLGGVRSNATITLLLRDLNCQPVRYHPRDDIWLETDDNGLVFCAGGTIPDRDTDADARTTWTGPLFAGCSGSGTVVMASGQPIPLLGEPTRLDIRHNSPDLDCNLVVNLSDLVLFTQDGFGGYRYRSDFYWDNVLNLSDLALMRQGLGAACP